MKIYTFTANLLREIEFLSTKIHQQFLTRAVRLCTKEKSFPFSISNAIELITCSCFQNTFPGRNNHICAKNLVKIYKNLSTVIVPGNIPFAAVHDYDVRHFPDEIRQHRFDHVIVAARKAFTIKKKEICCFNELTG